MAEGTQHKESQSINAPIEEAQLENFTEGEKSFIGGRYSVMTNPTEIQCHEGEKTFDCNCNRVGVMAMPGISSCTC